MNRSCGLLNSQKEAVPLKSIEVELEVRDHVATVVSTLNYENKEDKPLEAVFVFPLPGDAAVCHFSAQLGQTQIVAEVKEKQKACEEYDDALSSGQQAFLLEESDQSPDIFSLRVGSLPPGESASIRLEYVTELAVQADDGLRFCLPAVLNPRYQPQGSEGAGVQVTSVPASLVPYSLSFSARVSSPRPVSKVESNCSLDPLQYLNTDQTQATVKLAAGHKFDRDVELLIYYQDAHQPTAVVEAGQASAEPGSLMGEPVVMVSLYPEFPQSLMSSKASRGEFVFLMDRSGSMNYTRIRSARDTLLLLLKSLPMGCYFNIYSFGSRYEHIFSTSVKYKQKNVKIALTKIEQMEADLGGTEILEPLKHIYSQPCIPKQPRQLFVFTDGEVGNTKEVIDLVKKNSDSHRCFSFGIGEGASSALINGMAKEGGGHPQFITGTDRMQPKVMQSLRFALQPAVVDISVTWDLPKEVSVTVLSPPITTLFQGQRSLIYAQLTGQSSEAAEGCVTLKYSLAGHRSKKKLHFSLRPAEDTGLTVHRLGARTLIRSLEMEDRELRGQQDGGVKEKVVQLSVQSGVSSCFTAFIAVNRDNGRVIQGPMKHKNIPTPMTSAIRPALCGHAGGTDMWDDSIEDLEEDMCYNCLDEMDYGACNNSFGSLVSDIWDDSMEDLEGDMCYDCLDEEYINYVSSPTSIQEASTVPQQSDGTQEASTVTQQSDSTQEASTVTQQSDSTQEASTVTQQSDSTQEASTVTQQSESTQEASTVTQQSDSTQEASTVTQQSESTQEASTVTQQSDSTQEASTVTQQSDSTQEASTVTQQSESTQEASTVTQQSDSTQEASTVTQQSESTQEASTVTQQSESTQEASTVTQQSESTQEASTVTQQSDSTQEASTVTQQSENCSYKPAKNVDNITRVFSQMKKKLVKFWKSREMPLEADDAAPKSVPKNNMHSSVPEQPPRDPLLHLVSLQEASGCWLLDPALAAALGKTCEKLEKSKPALVTKEVWATILALIWLHGFKMDAKDEWELLAMKAASWIHAQNAPRVTKCVEAGNVLLGCSVKKEALGL
ncbi:von Willebrand factor A domain-containing protein 5A isoform X5 [Oreochromis niloticus]|uniref:von Willebrand factor A domain-containing protein 5A isoform X4 n=1 Tax=Oreochromis niloticus TaxID=8128 RepID=UPI00090535B1|nr:von Willebrand factor A domain-containing protein 5A isoform X4 [Oreochromis niloticus]XP_019222943.1 von Willebrand factor A domain-containing protein 5A isoform X6 [Oreochromis niloticus]XP_025753647.1 von Willebrand factor A domain-containing protein 5A isoform X5 [Oreochromis niloticus]